MAKIALQKLIWQSIPEADGTLERVEVALDGIVPKTVPLDVQEHWLAKGMVKDDPNQEMPERSEGVPSMLLPVMGNPPVRSRS